MRTEQADEERLAVGLEMAAITGSHRRTLEAIFRHPSAHNLVWSEVLALIGKLGHVHEQSNNEFVLELAGNRQIMHKPHGKNLTADAVRELRHFISKAGLSPELPSEATAQPIPAAPDLLIVVDHHGAKIFHVDVGADDASEHRIKPYDPHHFLHHLTHKDQSRERGQRAPEEAAFYEQIATAAAFGGKIVVVGHGTGHSNAAHHLVDYLRNQHRETYQRVVGEVVADLSAITPPQLLALARQSLHA
jgi:hypothetical protein